MASEYLLKQAKEQTQSVEPERVLTPGEKWKNWWDYHKWFVLIGLAVVIAIGYGIWDSVFHAPPKPDYQIAYVGENGLPEDTLHALETALAEKGMDVNGDGQVLVRIESYVLSANMENPQAMMGNQARLAGDMSTCEFFCYLLEDPASFQEKYEMLTYPDGRIPEEGTTDTLWLAWKDCPVLVGLELGSADLGEGDVEIPVENQRLLSELSIGRGWFMDTWDPEHQQAYADLWEAMTENVQ